ncbi:hypothetical protein FOXB_00592, partial [Fusarium oxysporum f. sp. conglutinans Fo5176]
LSTKLGKRQEAARFDGFTPKAVNWYFDIRENEYSWIKPEKTVNVGEGGIMVGFAHCSHGLQPLDNGIFNVIKGAYRKELQKLASLTDSALVDKVNFIRAYAKTREAGMRKQIILSGWIFTGNWPINHHKVLTHPEIQPAKEKVVERFKTPSPPQLHSDDTPKTSRQVRDLAKHRSRPTRQKYSKITKGLEALEMKVAVQNARITGLEEQMAPGAAREEKKRGTKPEPTIHGCGGGSNGWRSSSWLKGGRKRGGCGRGGRVGD